MFEVRTKSGVTIKAELIPGPHGPLWEVTDGRKYRALLPACPCDRKPCEKIAVKVGGRTRHSCPTRSVCDSGWHEPIVAKFVKAVARTIR